MKTILILVFATFTSIVKVYGQEAQQMNGIYKGYEDGKYIFTDAEDKVIEFNKITIEATKKYDLENQKYVGRQFILYFKVDTVLDDKDVEIQEATIVDILMPS